MTLAWFFLAVLFTVMYLFNVGVAVPQPTKTAVNVVGIIMAIILAILASTGNI